MKIQAATRLLAVDRREREKQANDPNTSVKDLTKLAKDERTGVKDAATKNRSYRG